jgi:Ser/Thr protein kinase RdoA (MazF antagonist)
VTSPDERGTREIAALFRLDGNVIAVAPHGSGHINSSWRVDTLAGTSTTHYLLQRINDRVFPEPLLLIENTRRIADHIAVTLHAENVPDVSRRVLTLVRARSGAFFVRDALGKVWRMFNFIDGADSRELARSSEDAYRAAFAYGAFQRRMSSYSGAALHETIPGFHDTPARLRTFEQALVAGVSQPEPVATIVNRALEYRHLAAAFEAPELRATLPRRVVHNDAKISNVLFDARTGDVLCVVDLDTAMHGLSLHDFGDMARTMCTDVGEDERDVQGAQVDLQRFQALVAGFTEGSGELLSPLENSLLVMAAKVITYEQAVRFLTDHLEGDQYYRVDYSGHNLQRAAAQLAILDAFTRWEDRLTRLLPL